MEKLFETIDEDPELLVVNSQPACLSLNHWDHERWGETPSSPDLQWIGIGDRRGLAPPGSWSAAGGTRPISPFRKICVHPCSSVVKPIACLEFRKRCAQSFIAA